MFLIETLWAEPAQYAKKTLMPIYEYSCARCGQTFEVIQKMSDKPLRTHAKCGGRLTKLISRAGFQFKGTGWYVTDYAKKSQGEGGDAPKDAGAESAKPADATGDSKEKPAAAASPVSTEKSEKTPKHPPSGKNKKS